MNDAPAPQPLSKDDQELIKLMRLMEALVPTEAWKQYVELLAKKSAEYMSNALNPKSTRDEDMLNKGALMALSHCMGLPHAIMKDARDVLARAGRTSEEE